MCKTKYSFDYMYDQKSSHFLVVLLLFTIVYVFEIIDFCRINTMEECTSSHLFQTPFSDIVLLAHTSCGGSIDSMEIGKYYKSKLEVWFC